MALRFELTDGNGAKAAGYYGFSWTTLFFGPLPALFRGDAGFFMGLLTLEILACGLAYWYFGLAWLIGASALVVGFAWALVYNEMHVLQLMKKGFRLTGEPEVVTALQSVFDGKDIGGKEQLLKQRASLMMLIAFTALFGALRWVGPIPERQPPARVVTPEPSQTAVVEPRVQPPPRPDPAPEPSTTTTPTLALDPVDACNRAMAISYDQDLPAGVSAVQDVSSLSTDELDRAVTACGTSLQQNPGSRRLMSQMGRAYAARAVYLAKSGNMAAATADMNKAVEQWTKAADRGSSAAQNFLGAYFRGTFNNSSGRQLVEPNFQKALSYWLASANAGNPRGARNAGAMLLLGSDALKQDDVKFPGSSGGSNPVQPDIHRARQFLDFAARKDPSAATFYGKAFFYGDPPALGKDTSKGVSLLTQACAAGDSDAGAFFDKEMNRPASKPLLPASKPPGC
ncbi:hypothetical protein [Bradyrhizobium sp. BR 10289]|uniref:tetratricopeptide repeat protein n=1 Tax=Bradyrhizobium sp. BR 10289 TaxID=2749993 RepID=UPI001C64E065|nr:hypothetical protein [Bradyrhizobium sp. BR 10289]MBW7968877.1 sel1 repeat family protein [Bradyrhizobium sp. BR 10289]